MAGFNKQKKNGRVGVPGSSLTQAYVDLIDAGNAQSQLILKGVGQHADWKTGECWPAVASLSAIGKCSDKTTRRHLRKMDDDGILTLEPRFRDDGGQTSSKITLVGYAKWAAAILSGGVVPAPTIVKKYDAPPGQLDHPPLDNSTTPPGQQVTRPAGQQVTTLELHLNTQLNDSPLPPKGGEARQRAPGENSHSADSEVKASAKASTRARRTKARRQRTTFVESEDGHRWFNEDVPMISKVGDTIINGLNANLVLSEARRKFVDAEPENVVKALAECSKSHPGKPAIGTVADDAAEKAAVFAAHARHGQPEVIRPGNVACAAHRGSTWSPAPLQTAWVRLLKVVLDEELAKHPDVAAELDVAAIFGASARTVGTKLYGAGLQEMFEAEFAARLAAAAADVRAKREESRRQDEARIALQLIDGFANDAPPLPPADHSLVRFATPR